MLTRNLLAGLALGLAMLAAPSANAGDARYDDALETVFQLTYGRELAGANVDKVVAGFREGAQKKAEAQKCPALSTAMDKFADNQFRRAVTAHLQSAALKDRLKGEMRKHFQQADLDAFIAFAASPAGKSYLDHSIAAEADVERMLESSVDSMMEVPEFKGVMGELMVELLPVMMQCQKG